MRLRRQFVADCCYSQVLFESGNHEEDEMSELTDAKYLSLATWRKNGKEVRTPVWFAATTERVFYCFSAKGAGKVKRLRNSSRAAVASCDSRGGGLGEWRSAEAYIVSDSGEETNAYGLLREKYGWQIRVTDFFSRLTGRINNRTVIRIELSA